MGSADDVIPTQLGRYRVERVLGAGAMGTVFEATDQLLGRRVAVKTVRGKGRPGEPFPQRFLNEAKAVAAVSHPNIVPIYDLGFEGPVPFIVMELVRGPTLKTRLEEAPCPPDVVRTLGSQLAQALETAHAAGIVHRDVKPANVLEAAPGLWKLADFGVAHVPDSSLTMTGQFVGSVAYAPPEALVLGQLGPPADVYGLGATLYEAACGRRPYADAQASNLGDMLVRAKPPALDVIVPGFPAALSAAILSTLAAEPGQRPTASALARAFAATATLDVASASLPTAADAAAPEAASPIARSRRSRAVVLALIGLAVAGGAVALVLAQRPDRAARQVRDAGVAVSVPVDAGVVDVAPPTDAAVTLPVREAIAGLPPLRDAVIAGRGSAAIRPLLALQKQHPKSGEIAYLLGLAYFAKRVDGEAVRLLTIAIAADPAYKTDPLLIKTTLQYGLQTTTYPWRVGAFLRTLGEAARPYLEEFAAGHPNAKVRAHAKTVLAGLR